MSGTRNSSMPNETAIGTSVHIPGDLTSNTDKSENSPAHGDASLSSSFRSPSTSSLAQRGTSNSSHSVKLYNTAVRHNFGSISQEYMSVLAASFCIHFVEKRHETSGVPRKTSNKSLNWRVTDRQRTVNAALVLCLNLGVDPPDIIKTHPCAKLEAWVDASQIHDSKKAIEQIGKNLQAQYETLSTRTKYKQCLDPNIEDAKRFCIGLRRSARDDRILFHYNGHGVPRPTPSGEIWVFNRDYTQYIPVSVYELQNWLGAPVIYCYDCSGSGNIIRNFNEFVRKRKEDEAITPPEPGATPAAAYEPCIQMAACEANEILPMHPKLPADLFTCCITTPVETSVKWFVLQHNLENYNVDTLTLPGKITDRRTPLGELNWIFTAISDTIAWSVLEPSLFKRLFRQDLVVAAMFRNFLLANRIMRTYNCHPVSSPALADTHTHPLWDSWDLAVSQYLLQVPLMQKAEASQTPYQYQHSLFFEEQLTAFEIWLRYRSTELDKPPEQLPILLQVLLSQTHRLRALLLLSRYLDLGPPAVRMALEIGFFIYVLKLLQSPAPELKPVLVFIWTRIMAVDYKNVQNDLVKENGYTYFVNILSSAVKTRQSVSTIPDINGALSGKSGLTNGRPDRSGFAQHRAMCAFVIAQFCRNNPQGQRLCNNSDLLDALACHIAEPESPLLREWSCLCLAELWRDQPETRAFVEQRGGHIIRALLSRLSDPVPEVRTACIFALTLYLPPDDKDFPKHVLPLLQDPSSLVRREAIIFFSKYVSQCLGRFIVCAFTTLEEEYQYMLVGDMRSESCAHGSLPLAVWRLLLVLTFDPMLEVREKAQKVVDYVNSELLNTNLGDEVRKMFSSLSDSHTSASKSVANWPISNIVSRSAAPASASPMGSVSQLQVPGSRPSVQRSKSSASMATITSAIKAARGWLLGDADRPAADAETADYPTKSDLEDVSAVKNFESMPNGCTHNPSNPVLPLRSVFYDWCVEYFTEPQLHNTESEEAGAEQYLSRLWRTSRNEQIIAETQLQKDMAVTGSWSKLLCQKKTTAPVSCLTFAEFEPHLVTADGNNGITILDWSQERALHHFSNGNIPNSHIVCTRFINEDDNPLLLTASSDGTTRVFRNYADHNDTELAAAWWMFADLQPPRIGLPVCVKWQQSRGALLVAGDIRVIRIFDAAREMVVVDVPVRTASPLTTLTSDQVAGNIIVTGFEDGSVHVYDRRLDPNVALVRRWKHHDASILASSMQRGGARELMTGSTDGLINLWDARLSEPVVSFRAHTKGMSAADIHEHAPVLATASRVIGVWSTTARRVSTVRCCHSLTTTKSVLPPVKNLAFHPHKLMLGVTSEGDSTVNIFQCTA